jgi:hypothetical protein
VPIAEWFRLDAAARSELRRRGSAVIQPAVSLETGGEKLLAAGITSATELERILQR